MSALLQVEELRLAVGRRELIHGVSFSLSAGAVTGLIGESGSGKTLTALSVIRARNLRQVRIAGGSIRLEGRELTGLGEAEYSSIRGRRIGFIYQDALAALTPVLTIGRMMRQVLERHGWPGDWRQRAVELIASVGIADPERILRMYPMQLSGGMRQRVMIALAVSCDPPLVIADEPTTALDVTVQARILELLRDLRNAGHAILLITHDMGVIAELADQVAVMYGGHICEIGPVDEIFLRPRHPYTRSLIAASARRMVRREDGALRFVEPAGSAHGSVELSGCPYATRCERAIGRCPAEMPPMSFQGDHGFACWNPVEE
jgi:oligopeptide/dipeptide ABC transporter ATP-binding protein